MTKTEYMIIASDNRLSNRVQNPNFYIGNETINRVSYTFDLGFIHR